MFKNKVFILLGAFVLFLGLSAKLGAQQQATVQIFVAGDSTAHNSGAILGWGDVLQDFAAPDTVKVVNHAVPGSSTRSFINRGLWDKLLAEVKSGDYVLLQFGHNDSSQVEDKTKTGRGTLQGIDPAKMVETWNSDQGNLETVYTYGFYLREMVKDAQKKGATVIILSPVPRNYWKTGPVFDHVMKIYTDWALAVATEFSLPFIDAEALISAYYVSIGQQESTKLFPQDKTHTGPEGAKISARIIAEALAGFRVPGFVK